MKYSYFAPGDWLNPIEDECDWESICRNIESVMTFPDKKSCPGLKLATFNGTRSNANVTSFTGIELDYDAGSLTLQGAAEILGRLGITAMVYSTPTYDAWCPRWRVLIPFSEPVGLDVRNRYMVLLARHLPFAKESNTPSQFYYFGRVQGVEYVTQYIEGDWLDCLPLPDVEPAAVVGPVVKQEEFKPELIENIRQALTHLSSDDRGEWVRIGQNLHHMGQVGFELWDEWSRKSTKYDQMDAIIRWRGFKGDASDYRSVLSKAQTAGWRNPGEHDPVDLSKITWGVDEQGKPKYKSFKDYSVKDKIAKLEARALTEEYVIDGIALRGQITILYAAPNAGKTLLAVHQLLSAIKRGTIQKQELIYLNCDDTFNGGLAKAKLLAKYEQHMLLPYEEDYDVKDTVGLIKAAIESGEAKGMVLVLDTLKKFTDLMDKGSLSSFMSLLRGFCGVGGTVIALAHINKNLGLNGKGIEEGVGDSKNDADCCYIISTLEDGDFKEAIFTNTKRRGSNSEIKMFRFKKTTNGMSYNDLLDSVSVVGDNEPAKEPVEDRNLNRIVEIVSQGNGDIKEIKKQARENYSLTHEKVQAIIDNNPMLFEWHGATVTIIKRE